MKAVPPIPTEVEVSVFGNGKGESILIHMGDGCWIVVDSFLERATKRPIPLWYLELLGLSPRQVVKLIVATHWDDDHIRGLAEVLSACSDARFACSLALQSEFFLRLVASAEGAVGPTGVEEFSQILGVLRSRGLRGPHHWVGANQRLLHTDGVGSVYSLSPSSVAINAALQLFASMVVPNEPQRRFAEVSRNESSVALWVEALGSRLLLGADLEEAGALAGWTAVVNSHERPDGRACVFKVPHHGSPDAHLDAVWTSLLEPSPLTVVTAFASSKRPRDTDVTRICSRTSRAYCTSRNTGYSPARRPSGIEKALGEIAQQRRVIQGPTGHVRARRGSGDSDWHVEYAGPASPMCSARPAEARP